MLIFITFILAPVSTQIIGLDFGTQSIKFAEFKNSQGFVILEDKMSQRKTHNLVSFCNGHPLYEYQGYQSYFKKKCISFRGTNTLLYDEQQNNINDQAGLDYEIQRENNNNKLIFYDKDLSKLLQQKDDKVSLRVEEIQALILKNVRTNIKATTKTISPQLMTTVPTQELNIFQRKSIKFIQQLSGFTPLGIIHENSAAALYYTYDRLKGMTQKLQNLLIINIGKRYTKLSLFTINNNNQNNKQYLVIRTEKHLNSTEFSGEILDLCLGKQIKDLLKKSKQKKRQAFKSIENTKIKLSVNKEYKISISDWENGKKFSKIINRNLFNDSCKQEFNNLKNILNTFKKSYNFDWASINLQGIGGVVRIPKVKQIIQEVFYQPAKNHINGDDSPALGATLLATKLVLSNYEKNITLREPLQHTYYMKLENQQEFNIFKNKIYSGQQIKFDLPFKQELKFQIRDSYQNQNIEYQLKRIDINNIQNGLINFTIYIDYFGLLQIKEIKLTAIQEIENDNQKNTKNIVKLIDYKIINIDNQSVLDFKQNLYDSKRFLKKITFQEEQKQYMGKIRNELESLLFQGKELIKDTEQQKFLKQNEINNIVNKVDQVKLFVESEDFAYDDEKINQNIQDLKVVLKPYKIRSIENKKRNSLIEEYDTFLNKCIDIIQNIRKERYWVPTYFINEQQQIFQTEIQKFEEQKQLQKLLLINDDPLILSEEIQQKKQFLIQHLQQVTTFPKNRKIYSFHQLISKYTQVYSKTLNELIKKQLKKIKSAL